MESRPLEAEQLVYLQIRPDMGAQAAADRYTGFSEHVGQDELEEALGYFEFAVAAYYVQASILSFHSLAQCKFH